MSADTDFLAAADATLAAIGHALDVASDASDADVDWSLNDGILEIEASPGGKIIVNRHGVNREIWVAARSGGFHYRATGGVWRDTRGGDALGPKLGALLREQLHLDVDLSGLPAAPG